MSELTVAPIATVRCSRTQPVDDDWDRETTTIELLPPYGPESLLGLETFSHLELVFVFHLAGPEPAQQSRRPRGRADWPVVGIFAQRGKDRPNHLGVSSCELLSVEGTTLTVRGLDAVDGTPVLDIKPYFAGFAPRTPVRQPGWVAELMAGYFRAGPGESAEHRGL